MLYENDSSSTIPFGGSPGSVHVTSCWPLQDAVSSDHVQLPGCEVRLSIYLCCLSALGKLPFARCTPAVQQTPVNCRVPIVFCDDIQSHTLITHADDSRWSKARFTLPELTARVDGWPVPITRQHGPCWRARVSTSRVDGPYSVLWTGL